MTTKQVLAVGRINKATMRKTIHYVYEGNTTGIINMPLVYEVNPITDPDSLYEEHQLQEMQAAQAVGQAMADYDRYGDPDIDECGMYGRYYH